jgi:hypothetical protein
MKTVFKSLCLFLCCSISGYAQSQDVALAQGEKMMQNHRAAFEENKGQVTGEDAQKVRYFYKEGSLSMFLLPTGLAYQFNQTHYPDGYKHLDKFAEPEEREKMEELAKNIRIETYRMDIELLGANPNPRISTDGKSQDYTQYYNHNALNVHNYSKITYHEVYPNIDWVLYKTNAGDLKYDFVVRAGGNPAQIQLKTNWVEDLQINADGGITLKNRMGSITEKAPVSLQGSQKIATRFVQEGDILRFDLGDYDRTQTLIIDPTLLWATYYGGTVADYGYSCAVDASDNIYLAGYTTSSTNIASGGHQNTIGGSFDAFLVKFNSAGTRQWATYYGGTGFDQSTPCAVDGSGNVYLAGYTSSTTNIASGGHQNTIGGGGDDAFLVKFNSAGTRQWATYYGGTGGDGSYSCAIDASDNVYLAGFTRSTTNIAAGGHQNTIGGGGDDAFLVKFNSAGTRQWATYYGGTGSDASNSCAVDASGNVYLAGYTESTTNIAAGGHQDTYGSGLRDAFLVKFNSAGTRQWATYYGGTGTDYGYSCAVDGSDNVYLAGFTPSTTNIASGGHQDTIVGGDDAFLVKFNSAGTRQWATYYGGTGTDYGWSCVVDASDNVYLAGQTQSTTNIASGGHQDTIGGSVDAFLVKFTGQPCLFTSATITQASCTSFTLNDSTYTASGTYTQNRTNAAGCDSTITLNLTINTQPTVTITQSGATLQATAGYTSYVWSLNGTIISSATNSSHTAIANGTYVVTITDANGCQNTTTINYTASNISEISSADFVKIFPNPSEGIVNINFTQDGTKVINIYDNLGRLIYQNSTEQLQNQISIQDLPNGVYQVQIIQSNAQITKSLIIAK